MMSQENLLNILVLDDETNIRKTLFYCLSAEGHTVITVSNADDAIQEARNCTFDMAFVDLKLGNDDGMDFIPVLIADSPWIKVVVITAYASIETAVEAIRRGAIDYIPKPFSPDQVKLITQRIARLRELETQVTALKEDLRQFDHSQMVNLQSKNTAMRRVIETTKKAASSDAIILLLGESGTGKSILARAIHHWSPRATKPMGIVTCPAVPSDLLESELFGHVRGAFTGAIKDNPGRIAACDGGTLFLDEIGDMALPVQSKLLRFIQDKEYERLGDSILRKANVRIIAATNADLVKLAADGRFREDLYYRLNVISLTIPPLRERLEDILTLAEGFLTFFCHINHKPLFTFTKEAVEFLSTYSYPGNIRELRNMIERAVILGNGQQIGEHDLTEKIAPSSSSLNIGDLVPLRKIEEIHIRRIIAKTSSLQEAADILGVDQATLWRKRKAYKI
jgi:NtrC-family two-component system response regulator AlgB